MPVARVILLTFTRFLLLSKAKQKRVDYASRKGKSQALRQLPYYPPDLNLGVQHF